MDPNWSTTAWTIGTLSITWVRSTFLKRRILSNSAISWWSQVRNWCANLSGGSCVLCLREMELTSRSLRRRNLTTCSPGSPGPSSDTSGRSRTGLIWISSLKLRGLAYYSFVLIGQVFNRDVSELEALPNVFLLGNKNYRETPSYLHNFDACTIPFLLNQVTHARILSAI